MQYKIDPRKPSRGDGICYVATMVQTILSMVWIVTFRNRSVEVVTHQVYETQIAHPKIGVGVDVSQLDGCFFWVRSE
jgi:hypothetical protein